MSWTPRPCGKAARHTSCCQHKVRGTQACQQEGSPLAFPVRRLLVLTCCCPPSDFDFMLKVANNTFKLSIGWPSTFRRSAWRSYIGLLYWAGVWQERCAPYYTLYACLLSKCAVLRAPQILDWSSGRTQSLSD